MKTDVQQGRNQVSNLQPDTSRYSNRIQADTTTEDTEDIAKKSKLVLYICKDM